MNNYEKYTSTINKLFEILELMKKELPDQDNLNYISSIEEYKDTIISVSQQLKENDTTSIKVEELGND